MGDGGKRRREDPTVEVAIEDEIEVDVEVDLGEEAFDDDVPTAEYPHDLIPNEPPVAANPEGMPMATLVDADVTSEAGEVLSKLLTDAEERVSRKLFLEAIDLLELALMLDPKNDVIRARLMELTSKHKKGSRPSPRRADDTVEVDLD